MQPREAARAHRHRPHRGDPRHLRPERLQPRGQGAGRAGAAAATACPGCGARARALSQQGGGSRRAASAPAVRARPSSRSTAAASCAASTSSRPSCATSTRHRATQRKARHRRRIRQRRHRRLHERRQVDPAQPPDRRRRARRGPPVRHPRPDHPPPGAARRRGRAADRHRRLRPQAAPPAGRGVQVDARGGRRGRPARPRRRRLGPRPRGPRSTPCARCWRDRRRRRARAAGVQQGRPRPEGGGAPGRRPTPARWPSRATTGEGIEDLLRTVGDRLRALTHRDRAADPLRPGRRPGRGPPRGRGARRAGRRRRHARPGPPRRRASLGQFLVESRWPCDDGRHAEGFVPPPYPYDRLDELQGRGRRACRAGSSTCRSARRATRPRPWCVEALATSGAERGYPPSIGTAAYREAAAALDGAPARRDGRPGRWWRPASAPRSSWPGCPHWLRLRRPDRDTVLYPAVSYPTYAMGATLAGCRRGRAVDAVALDLDDRPGRRRPGAVPVGQHARQPRRRPRRPRRGGGLGPGPRRAGALRRVLRRVHLGRAAAHDPRARHRGRAGRALAVQALQPGRRPGRRSTPATPTSSRTCPRCASTPGSWCPARCRPPRSPPGPTTTTSTSSATGTPSASTPCERRWPLVGVDVRAARRRVLPLGPGARRRRVGPHPAPGRGRRARS